MTTTGKVDGTRFADVDTSGDPDARVRYLDTATAQFGEYKRNSFATLHLKPGMSVLDAGCGAGDDVREIAELVSPGGKAVGIDNSTTMIETSTSRSANRAACVEFVHGSLYELPFPDDMFDATRSDRVFQHLNQPERALQELIRVTRPGGRVNAIDPDFGGMIVDTDNRELLLRFDAVSRRARSPSPGSAWRGRQLWSLFNQAGLEDIQVQAAFLWTTELLVANQISNVINWASEAYEANDATLEEVECWEAEMTERAAQGRFFGGAPVISVTGTVTEDITGC